MVDKLRATTIILATVIFASVCAYCITQNTNKNSPTISEEELINSSLAQKQRIAEESRVAKELKAKEDMVNDENIARSICEDAGLRVVRFEHKPSIAIERDGIRWYTGTLVYTDNFVFHLQYEYANTLCSEWVLVPIKIRCPGEAQWRDCFKEQEKFLQACYYDDPHYHLVLREYRHGDNYGNIGEIALRFCEGCD